MEDKRFIINLLDDEDVDALSEAIAHHLDFIVSDAPSDLDANAVRGAIESYVSDIIKAEVEE